MTWSHASLYVGDALGIRTDGSARHELIEVNLGEGCVSSPLSKYTHCNTRICRPVNLTEADCERVIDFMIEHLGLQYDMRNVIDLARYLLPVPPVPTRWRRHMIALGSGEPSRYLLDSDSCGIPIGSLPNLAADRVAAEKARGTSGLLTRIDPAHPPPPSVRAVRLRPVALLRDRKADRQGGI